MFIQRKFSFTPSQNIIIPLFLHFEAFGPSYTTAAEFWLPWSSAQVFRVNYILLSISLIIRILSNELEMMTKTSHNLEKLIKNMAYIYEHVRIVQLKMKCGQTIHENHFGPTEEMAAV